MWSATSTGRFAKEALSSGEGEVCAVFRRSFYLRFPGERYACVGDASLGRGPLNALVDVFHLPEQRSRIAVSIERASVWEAPRTPPIIPESLDPPEEGLGCLLIGAHNPLVMHAQPALEALDDWLVGNALRNDVEQLIGLGPGLTPSGDDYLGGMMIALRLLGRGGQADALWRWLEPRLASRTSGISAAHLRAAAAGEGHEALHEALHGDATRLDSVGHCSGWDALAGAGAVLGNNLRGDLRR